jgi:Protein of unknown function (DUF3662)/FHA domain
MLQILRKIENVFQSAFEGGTQSANSSDKIEPLDLVRQIEREIERNKRIFINDRTYVAHKIVIHLHAPTQSRIEEYEALFNNPDFRKYLEEYIAEKGYQLLDHIRIVVQCHQEMIPEFGKRHCFVEFSWPQATSDPGEVTVVLDMQNNRILSVNAPRSEVAETAWLDVLEGKAYQSRVTIGRSQFNVGRTENVLNSKGDKLLRVNHLAFVRPAAGDAINRTVSRQHARIEYRGKSFFLYDTGSQNGTSVQRGTMTIFVPQMGPAAEGIEIEDGDVLMFGSARVAFHVGKAGETVPR